MGETARRPPRARPKTSQNDRRGAGRRPPGGDVRRDRAAPRREPADPNTFHQADKIRQCLEQVLATSVADETEIVWLERRSARAASRQGDEGFYETPRLSVIVRVVESGRQGWYRTDTADPHQLESGIRQALAMSKVQTKLKRRPMLPTDTDELRVSRRLLDPEISRLKPQVARKKLQEVCDEDEAARLSWTDTRLVIYNSHGLRRSAATTEATLHFESGSGPGAGYAATSARRLADIDPLVLRERARARRGAGSTVPHPDRAVPVLLSPEATVQWLSILNMFAFSGRSFLDGTSFLTRHRNIQVFDHKVNLCDDATASGLPFPFDFEGSRKEPLELIVQGKPSTPALNHVQSAQAGLKPTAHAVGGQDALFSNLFLLPGETSEDDLVTAAEGGLRVGWLERVECYEPAQLKVRMVARGVRRIENGVLGASVPDCVWHESLLGALARLRAIGDAPVELSTATTPLGGISTPGIVLEESGGFQALREDL